jgi:hypothetical protein
MMNDPAYLMVDNRDFLEKMKEGAVGELMAMQQLY